MAGTQSAQLTARLETPRGAGGVVSMMGVLRMSCRRGPRKSQLSMRPVYRPWRKMDERGERRASLRTLLSLAPADLRQIKEGLATAREEQAKKKKKKRRRKRRRRRAAV